MNYGEVLSRAWHIIWKHKVLWIFGILAGCAGGNRVNFNFNRGDFSNQTSGNPPQAIAGIEHFFSSLNQMEIVLLIAAIAVIVLVIVIISIFLGTVGRIGLIRGAQQADRDESASLSFGELFRGSLPYFWRVFLLGLLVGLVIFVIVMLLVVLGIGAAVLTLGLALICLLPLICLFIPVMWAVTVLVEQATVAIVVENLGILAGLKRGWEVVKTNIAEMIVMFLILILGVSMVGGLVIALPMIVTMIPIFIGILAGKGIGAAAMVIGLVCFVAYLPVMLVLNGILYSYVGSAWTLTFLRLTAPSAPVPALTPEPALEPVE